MNSAATFIQIRECKNGHKLNADNRRTDYRGSVQCLTCERNRKGRKRRTCGGCGSTVLRGAEKICQSCKTARGGAYPGGRLRHEPKKESEAERTCTACDGLKPLAAFSLDLAERRLHTVGRQFSTECNACRVDPDYRPQSPYEIAKVQIETMFGLPSREWINKANHPLNVLHFARMRSIHDSRCTMGSGLRPLRTGPNAHRWTTSAAREQIHRAGLKPLRSLLYPTPSTPVLEIAA